MATRALLREWEATVAGSRWWLSKTVFSGENCLLLIVCKLSYNHRESDLWETRRWAKGGNGALTQLWPSPTSFTSGKVRAVDLQTTFHAVNSLSLGLNHTLMHLGTLWFTNILKYSHILTYRHTDILTLWHTDLLTYSHILWHSQPYSALLTNWHVLCYVDILSTGTHSDLWPYGCSCTHSDLVILRCCSHFIASLYNSGVAFPQWGASLGSNQPCISRPWQRDTEMFVELK